MKLSQFDLVGISRVIEAHREYDSGNLFLGFLTNVFGVLSIAML